MAEEKPKPQIFAIMRNGHEVIRGGMVDLKEAVDNEDMNAAKATWEKLSKWTDMHKTMEEGNGTDEPPIGFFKVLDAKVDSIVSNEGLYDLHEELHQYEEICARCIADSDMESLKIEYPKFVECNEKHLKKEEDVMMPCIQKMMMAKEPMKKIMVDDILATVVDSPDFEFFIKYANEILEKHHGGMPRARVFDHALWAVATPEQWDVWSGWMKEALTEKTFCEIEELTS